MRIVFATASLALIETARAGETRLPVSVIRSARRKLTVLKSASDDRSLRNWRSLRYEQSYGNTAGQGSVFLGEQYKMIIELHEDTDPQVLEVIAIEGCP